MTPLVCVASPRTGLLLTQLFWVVPAGGDRGRLLAVKQRRALWLRRRDRTSTRGLALLVHALRAAVSGARSSDRPAGPASANQPGQGDRKDRGSLTGRAEASLASHPGAEAMPISPQRLAFVPQPTSQKLEGASSTGSHSWNCDHEQPKTPRSYEKPETRSLPSKCPGVAVLLS